MTLVFEAIALCVLFCLSAFFSSSESALFSLDPLQIHKIRKKHPRTGQSGQVIGLVTTDDVLEQIIHSR